MKALNIILCILFVLSAGLQYNDPDPLLWIVIYLYTAVFCLLAFRDKYYPRLYLAGISLYGIYAIYLLFDKTGVLSWALDHNAENIAQSMKASAPWIEETREFFGLLILIIALAINLVYYKRTIGVSSK